MSPRPPRDGVVALRSLPRRFRALFAGLDDDESPDALAVRPGADGTSALGHVAAATQAIQSGSRALGDLLAKDGAVAEPVVAGAARTPGGSVEERLSELGWEADALADRAEHVGAEAWGRTGTVGGTGAGTSAADAFWSAVDLAVEHLKAAERALDEARRQR